jgi:hypothetical protein
VRQAETVDMDMVRAGIAATAGEEEKNREGL